MNALDELIAAAEAGDEDMLRDVCRDLNRAAHNAGENWPAHEATKAFRGSLDAALALFNALLPGWGYRVGSCCVSDDAAVFPDFNCPTHGDRLRATLDEARDWFEFTDVDQRPPGNPARALLLATLRAYRETQA